MSASLFALLDDIATLLDDVSVMSKVAAKKTVGVISDDLALNANQVQEASLSPKRELPIVWGVAKGSLLNKVILIPLALLLSVFLPQAITPLLMVGGAYLCYEGFEKVLEKLGLISHEHHNDENGSHGEISTNNNKLEKSKIIAAIRTDFILSAEIIILALGVLQAQEQTLGHEISLMTKILSLSAVGLGITIFVYGLVAIIVKLDDIGLWMMTKKSKLNQTIGNWLVLSMPYLMKSLSAIGTIAMFIVGGGIFIHHIHDYLNLFLTENIIALIDGFLKQDLVHSIVSFPLVSEILMGIIVGVFVVFLTKIFSKIKKNF